MDDLQVIEEEQNIYGRSVFARQPRKQWNMDGVVNGLLPEAFLCNAEVIMLRFPF